MSKAFVNPAGSEASRRAGELLSIQYLRAIAAIAVLCFHAAERSGVSFGAGAAGVDIFFVISGFIMSVINAGKPMRPLVFLKRRATRIFPLYCLVTLVMAGLGVAAPALFPHLQPTVGHIVKSLLFYPHRDATGLVAPLLVPGWTLNYEVFFYLVFAVSLMIGSARQSVLLTVLLGVLVILGPLAPADSPVLTTYTSPLLLEFLAGFWLGKAWTSHMLPGPVTGLALLVCGAGFLIAVTATGIDIEPLRIFLWGLPALAIVTGAVSIERAGHVPNWPILKFLGDGSYSIYLVHGLALSAVARILAIAGIASAPGILAGGIAGGLLGGGICYLAVEKPLIHLFRRRRPASPVPVTGLGTETA